MTPLEYCRDVCGAKCCHLRSRVDGVVPCPKLRGNNTCSIYKERFAEGQPDLVVVGHYRSKVLKNLHRQPVMMPVACERIAHQIARRALPPEVEANCCFAHPEILSQGE